jgi:hypothetical protein
VKMEEEMSSIPRIESRSIEIISLHLPSHHHHPQQEDGAY